MDTITPDTHTPLKEKRKRAARFSPQALMDGLQSARTREALIAYLFLLPFLAFFTVFVCAPSSTAAI